MAFALSFLQQNAIHGQDSLEIIITDDGTRVHCTISELKSESMKLKYLDSTRTRKFKVMPSTGKMMAAVFLDQKGVLLVNVLERGETINAVN